MTSNEFREIHECWAELKICFDEIDALNAEAEQGKGIAGFGMGAAQTASAR
jgi:hypothetical protein